MCIKIFKLLKFPISLVKCFLLLPLCVKDNFVCLARQNRVSGRTTEISHFQVTLCLCFKTSPRENVSYENSSICMKMNLKVKHIFICRIVSHVLTLRQKASRKLPFDKIMIIR